MSATPCAVADLPQVVELARVAVDVDGDDRSRPLRDRGLDRLGRQVERPRIDVGEDGRRTLVDRAVGGCDEGVGRGDHLVAGADSGGDAEEMESRSTARDRGGVRRVDRLGERLLEAIDRRTEREAARPEHVGDELLLPVVEPGRGEADRPDGRHGRYATDGVSSTTSR